MLLVHIVEGKLHVHTQRVKPLRVHMIKILGLCLGFAFRTQACVPWIMSMALSWQCYDYPRVFVERHCHYCTTPRAAYFIPVDHL